MSARRPSPERHAPRPTRASASASAATVHAASAATVHAATALAAAPTPVPWRDDRPIVVGFDGSPASESAVDRALLIAGSLGVPVRLVAAWHRPKADVHLQGAMDASVAARFGVAPPSWLSTATVEGAAAPVLLAESRAAQMLVVGSRGHGGFAGLLLGSVSSACAEHAECPVLVMHAPRVEHEDPVSAGAEALGDGSRASDPPRWVAGG
jgi:nucleotide-binding universal stress UspA family protein